MRHYYRFIILSTLFLSGSASALEFFVEGLEWRATETNNWAYINSETLPHQTINYKTIDFNYSPGFRIGVSYVTTWDALFSYTRFYTTANNSATGLIRPSFVGSVTAQQTPVDLYTSGQVSPTINYNIFDIDFGKRFYPAEVWMWHPMAGIMGGWINQTIQASYQGSPILTGIHAGATTSTTEKITNNFIGIGPKAGVDTSITLFNYHDYQPKLVAVFAASYLVGNWVIRDVTNVIPKRILTVSGSSQSMGALTLQGSIGLALDYKKFAVKVAYELSDWFNQNQFFDNDTGTHNNDLILQGLVLGITYDV